MEKRSLQKIETYRMWRCRDESPDSFDQLSYYGTVAREVSIDSPGSSLKSYLPRVTYDSQLDYTRLTSNVIYVKYEDKTLNKFLAYYNDWQNCQTFICSIITKLIVKIRFLNFWIGWNNRLTTNNTYHSFSKKKSNIYIYIYIGEMGWKLFTPLHPFYPSLLCPFWLY